MKRPDVHAPAPDLAAVVGLHVAGKLQEAEQGYRSLIARGAGVAAVYSNLAAICISSGRPEEGIALLRQAIAQAPDFADAHHNLAVMLQNQGQIEEAIAAFRQAARLAPDSANAHYHLGLALALRGPAFSGEAVHCFRQAIQRDPAHYLAHHNLGVALSNRGERDAAIAPLQNAARICPDDHQAFHQLGLVFYAQKRFPDAVTSLEHAVVLNPGDHEALLALGVALHELGRNDEAIAVLHRAVILRPNSGDIHSALGEVLAADLKFDDAIAALERSIAVAPHSHIAYGKLAKIFTDQGRVAEALALYQKAIDLRPDDLAVRSSYIYTLSTTQALPPPAYLEVSRDFEKATPGAIAMAQGFPRRVIDPRAKLRVGFVSAEIGSHSVSYFLESYLRNYNRDRIALTLYGTVPRDERRTIALLELADHAIDLAHASNEEARTQILADEIDILIDTTAHTAGSRLEMLARRCAPIQCHYIGALSSTGVAAIDYFIGDADMTPPEFDSHFSERVMRLSRMSLAYASQPNAPDPAPPAADTVTFGCFNNLSKVREQTLALWAEVLRAVPEARLLLKDRMCADAYTRNRIAMFLGARGIETERITFVARAADWRAHMALYNQIDVALDTLPLNSVTTGFEALFMGTPLIGVRDNWMGGRMSSAILKALGRPEWIADDADDYRRIALDLVSDRSRLRGFKKTLRGEMLRSPLCDGKSLAAALEDGFETMVNTYNAQG